MWVKRYTAPTPLIPIPMIPTRTVSIGSAANASISSCPAGRTGESGQIIDELQPEDVVGFLCVTDDVIDFVAIADKEIKMVRSINVPDRAIVEIKKLFNDPHEVVTVEMETIVDLLYSELSSSINYFQMQTGYIMNKVFFSAATELQKNVLERLSEKSYVPLEIPELYEEYSTASFDASMYAGCISLAKVALEG